MTNGTPERTPEEVYDIQQANTQPFNSDSDNNYLELSRQLDDHNMAEVNIKSDELHSLFGSDVSITMYGDRSDQPSIQGKVVQVQNGTMSLAPALINSREMKNTTIDIKHIEKCASLPETWDQPEQGPALYTAEKAKLQCEEPALEEQKSSHNQQPLQDLQGPVEQQEEMPRSRPTTPGKWHRIQLVQKQKSVLDTPAKLDW